MLHDRGWGGAFVSFEFSHLVSSYPRSPTSRCGCYVFNDNNISVTIMFIYVWPTIYMYTLVCHSHISSTSPEINHARSL